MKRCDDHAPFEDERGTIRDLVRNERINDITIITTRAGAVRGNHIHQETWQYIHVAAGEIQYLARDEDGNVREETVGAGATILSEPGEPHAIVSRTDSTMYVFTRGPRGGDRYEADTVRLETPLVEPR